MKRIFYLSLMLMIAVTTNAQDWSKELEKDAKNGNSEAQLVLGDAYFKGSGTKRNLDKAAKWYYAATLQGNEKAKEKFYSFYSKQLEKFAKSGDAQAQYEVGCDYLTGEGVDKDIKTAAEWFLLAVNQNHEKAIEKLYSFYSKELEEKAKLGDVRAQYEIGNCYYHALEVQRDTETAAEWYFKAMNQGHQEATEKFYSFYSKELEKSAKNGDARAQFETGNSYYSGNGVERDTKTASEWFLKSMSQGHEGAKEKFYSFYSKELEKRAKEGDARAQFETGNGYYLGYLVKKDNDTAAKWYLKSMSQGHEGAKEKFYSFYSKDLEKFAKNGDARAQFEIGNCYFTGNNVERDTETAAEWYLKSMTQGHEGAKEKFYSFYSKELLKRAKSGEARAQFEVGNGYYLGSLVKRDTESAAEWYLKAMSQGHEGAKEKFYSFYSKELEKRAKEGDADAQFEVANSYYTGNIVKRDIETAAEWYQKAMSQGHDNAKDKFYSFYSKELEKFAKKGDARAQFETGNFYFAGNGVNINKEVAAEWYLLSKDQGFEAAAEKFYSYYSKVLEKNAKKDTESLYRIGCFYMDGIGLKKDLKKGFKLLLNADKQGHPEAFNKFSSIYSKELQKMAKKGHPRAQLAVAKCYLYGNGVVKNEIKAKSLLGQLTESGECGEEAKKLLETITAE